MSAIFRRGFDEAVRILDEPSRIERHDPAKIFSRAGLSAGMSVVDLGCGTGFFSIPASEIVGNNGTIFAIDTLKPMLNIVSHKLTTNSILNVHLLQSNAVKIPIKDDTVDLFLLANIYFDLPKRVLLPEVRRVLRRTGKMIILEWKKIPTTSGPPLEQRLTMEDASKYLVESNYRIDEIFDASATHYCIITTPIREA
ncbi:MAG TPA: class I SAM-dependent methyltransferase [Nitrososphaerales archaeon]|nr:class I SAM-dependent methyltransferase [Nitrososphaerales archaeon]